MKIKGKYNAIKTPIKNLEKTIKNLSNKGYKGVNLTIPLKEEALKYLDRKDRLVNITGAANVLIFSKQGQIEGKNTDVYGFKKSLINLVKNKPRRSRISNLAPVSETRPFEGGDFFIQRRSFR